MAAIARTMKLHIHLNERDAGAMRDLTETYRQACNYVSQYIFDNGFKLSVITLHKKLYYKIRETFNMKAQLTQSCIKTVVARYKTTAEQLKENPCRYKDEAGKWHSIPRTLEWRWEPILFSRPQADFVYGRDYSFIQDRKTGSTVLSLNNPGGKRIHAAFDVPACFEKYFGRTEDGKPVWKFGTAKLVTLCGEWYFHISVTTEVENTFDRSDPKYIVGMDRGLRFLSVPYDEHEGTKFFSGKDILSKKEAFQNTRSELQAKGTKSAKRALKRISGRENRWMTDVNHQLSKTLVRMYGADALFVIEDLTGVSFNEKNLSSRGKEGRRQLRGWAFYQLEQFLLYKVQETDSFVLKVQADYTSQRCPKCGKIRKENRNLKTHEYKCDCGFCSNDDRASSMNLEYLGKLYVSGVDNPHFEKPKAK